MHVRSDHNRQRGAGQKLNRPLAASTLASRSPPDPKFLGRFSGAVSVNDAKVARLLAVAVEDLVYAANVVPERLRAMRDAQAGWPRSVRFDGDGISSGSGSDPTGSAALDRDLAAADREALEAAVLVLAAQARSVYCIVSRYSPRAPTPSERAETLRANERAEICESCARALTSMGHPRAEPAARRVQVRADLRLWLCRWCADWHRDTGRLPTEAQLVDHHAGRRVLRRVAR